MEDIADHGITSVLGGNLKPAFSINIHDWLDWLFTNVLFQIY